MLDHRQAFKLHVSQHNVRDTSRVGTLVYPRIIYNDQVIGITEMVNHLS